MAKTIKKLYYSIGEVSKITGLKQYVLRYWETEFPSLSPTKNRAGNRVYREKDIQLINYIKYLLYDSKFTIEGARQKVKQMTPEMLNKFEESDQIEELVVENSNDDDKIRQVVGEIKKGLKEILDILDEFSGIR